MARIDRSPDPLGPLTAAVFHILLALADGRKHGYAIMKQVAADGGSSLRMGPGTLYGSLQRMAAAGLVEERVEEEDDERRRYYQKKTGGGQKRKKKKEEVVGGVRRGASGDT